MLGGVATCPCEGKKTDRWHRDRGVAVCEDARVIKNFQARQRRAGIPIWIPGTDIDIPEVEEL